MKTAMLLVTLATIITVALCDMKDYEKWSKDCMGEAKVTEAELKEYFSKGMNSADAKDNVKCHLKCLLEKQGIWVKGAYNPDVAIKLLKEVPQLKEHFAAIEEAVNNCKNEKGTNECDTAFKITHCIKEHKAQMKN